VQPVHVAAAVVAGDKAVESGIDGTSAKSKWCGCRHEPAKVWGMRNHQQGGAG